MSRSKPLQWHCWRAALVIFATALSFASVAHGQRAAGRATTPARPVFRPYIAPRPTRPIQQPMMRVTPRPMLTRPVGFAYPRPMPMPVRRAPQAAPPRIAPPIRDYVAPRVAAHQFAQPAFAASRTDSARFQPRSNWRGPGAGWYFNSFLFGGPWVPDFGYWQPPAQYQMLPLGFGWWPACDSASIPGRFATIGPCFGMGDYQSVASNYSSEYLPGTPPPEYPTLLQIIEEPQAGTPASAQQQSGASAQKPNMVVDLTSGKEMEVSDWWVTGGRFYFIPIGGNTQTVDLDSLDLRKTIEANEKRGRTFMLNFTPPDQRPSPPASPSNQ